MKKLSIILSAFAVAILLFDHLARIQHWVANTSKEMMDQMTQQQYVLGSDPLNGLPVLGFIFLALAAFLYNTANKNPVYPSAGVTLLIMVIGYLFKILHWPGAGVILVLSFGFFIVIIVPWFTFVMMKGSRPQAVEEVPDVPGE